MVLAPDLPFAGFYCVLSFINDRPIAKLSFFGGKALDRFRVIGLDGVIQ